ncbi:MAG: EAL domain-containing protein [Roseburia sp.]|nr:EAL domain-containing protein [Roseburia sp.]
MVQGFFLLSCLLAAALFIGIIKLNKIKHVTRGSIQLLFGVAIITVLWNAGAVIAESEGFAVLAHGMYFACTDWLVIALLMYARKFTEHFKNILWGHAIIIGGATIDTLSMLLNVWSHHVFTGSPTLIDGRKVYLVSPKYPMYAFHLAYVYAIVLLVVMSLLFKACCTIKLYRRKYEMILLCFLCILAVNIGYRFTDITAFDISPIVYSALAISICYFTLFYVPRDIVAKLLSFSIAGMDNGIVCFDCEGKCIYANQVALKLFQAEENPGLLENTFTEWLDGRSVKEIDEYSWQEKRGSKEHIRYYDVGFHPLKDKRNNYLGCFFSIDDRTENMLELERERYRAKHDSLTGIYNREGFFDAVRNILCREPDIEHFIICSDIKDFKLINDLFGTEKGDEILKKTAEFMRAEAKAESAFGRLGSDHFAMCIRAENFHPEIFEKCIHEICMLATNSVYRMHMHVGVYRVTDPDSEIAVLCDRAFMAIRRIKDNYQQIIAYYDNDLGSKIHNEKKMISEFDQAIEEGQFQIYLQPQISVNQKILGAEALVRWLHPGRGLVPPGDFIPVFEKTGFIHRLDRYVWELACKKLKEWKEQGREDLHISVNISPKDFYYIDIYKTFTGLVEQYGIRPENLKLEITETALMSELKNQFSLLERLRTYGFHIEIDDFGSGYSSLNTLKDIDVDVLKLDMGFLSDTINRERSRTIMNMVIAMSKQLGLSVVSEGVETSEQVDYLTQAGCDIFQGYYFARPMPTADFEKMYF